MAAFWLAMEYCCCSVDMHTYCAAGTKDFASIGPPGQKRQNPSFVRDGFAPATQPSCLPLGNDTRQISGRVIYPLLPTPGLSLLISFHSYEVSSRRARLFHSGKVYRRPDMDPNARVPVSQYLRMSTEHQRYSLENQASAIEKYAESHGFSVIHTYSDAARSGVVFRRREGLQQLIQDVVTRAVVYKAILVYDVSRWGRFQDCDEAAYYEFLCKSAGIPVHYCAESFANDNAMPSILLKALKRAMAGEYSRELGCRVYAGQKRLAQLGYRQGAPSGYGLRRLLVRPDGAPKQNLRPGERKSIC